MNAEVYLFGDLGAGYTQYVNDSTKSLFKLFVDKAKANSQLIIHREDTLMYYTYIRRFRSEESSNRYIGISYVLNNRFIKDFDELFSIFEGIITTIVSRGIILEYTNNGQIVSSLGKIYKAKSEFAHISACLKTELDALMAGKNDTLPVLDYSINTTETKIYRHTDDKSEIIKALSTYPNVFIIKDKNYDNPEAKSYANILYRLNKENTQLKDINTKLNRQNKRTTIVTILSIIVAIGCIAIICFVNHSNEQQIEIARLQEDQQNLQTHIINLQWDSVLLKEELVNTRDTLFRQTKRVYKLQQDSMALTQKSKELSANLATANNNITAYKRTIERKDKEIRDKERTISNLQSQLKSNSASNSIVPIEILGCDVASIKKNGSTIACNFGSTIYSSHSYKIKVKMKYKSETRKQIKLTIKLFGPSSRASNVETWYATESESVTISPSSGSNYTFRNLLGKQNGDKLQSGNYRIEIYDSNENKLKEKTFTIR